MFTRTVTYVGSMSSSYNAVISSPPGLEITVKPSVLMFKSLGEKQVFTVTVVASVGTNALSGSLVWDDGVDITVRSPIVAFSTSA